VFLVGPLPREHGAWAMLVVPWIVGCGIARALTLRAGLVLLGALALFLAQHRLTECYRGWRRSGRAGGGGSLVFLTVLGLAAAAPALAAMPPSVVAALSLAALAATAGSLLLVDARLDHALPGQALAAVSLALTAPTAFLASGGAGARAALGLWLVNAAFFLWAVGYVNLQIEARGRRAPLARPADRVRFAARVIAVDVALALVAVVALRLADLSPRGMLAFAPAAVQAIAGIATLHRPAPLKRVGIAMLVHALAFAGLLIVLA
jgi:hypothetical protein